MGDSCEVNSARQPQLVSVGLNSAIHLSTRYATSANYSQLSEKHGAVTYDWQSCNDFGGLAKFGMKFKSFNLGARDAPAVKSPCSKFKRTQRATDSCMLPPEFLIPPSVAVNAPDNRKSYGVVRECRGLHVVPSAIDR